MSSTVKDWISDLALPIIRVAAAAFVAWEYATSWNIEISKKASEQAKALVSQLITVASPQFSAKFGLAVYSIHLALPTIAIFVVLFAIIGGSKNGSEVASYTLRGFGWVLIAIVIGIISTFILPIIGSKIGH